MNLHSLGDHPGIPRDQVPAKDRCQRCGHSILDHYDCYELDTDPFCLVNDCDCEAAIRPWTPSP